MARATDHSRLEQERRRWARELHDETLQNLAALRLALSAARRAGRPDVLVDAVDDAITELGREIVNVRSLIADQRPEALDRLGTEGAIAALAQRAARRGTEVRYDIALQDDDSDDPRGRELSATIYRVVQEALNNAIEHGRARRVFVHVREMGHSVRIAVRDDGQGFDPAVTAGGVGLLGMRERVELFDGTLRIHSTPGRGAELRATLTVPASQAVNGRGLLQTA
jgi:signal transduction histidine kinase